MIDWIEKNDRRPSSFWRLVKISEENVALEVDVVLHRVSGRS